MKGVKENRLDAGGKRKNSLVTAVVANQDGEVFDLKGYAAVGRAGSALVPLTLDDTVNMPYGGELMLLPDRTPVLYHIETNRIEAVAENPYVPKAPIFPVAAFNSPGYVITHVSAFEENAGAGYLPLFSYGAVGWHRGRFRSSVLCVDRERRQDLRLMSPEKILAGVKRMKQKMPLNRLRQHLEKCAMTYGCPAAKNFFLGRYEAPLPTARHCNARCLGCISLQKEGRIPNTQERISFSPTPEEIAEVALEQIRRVKNCVVSFGQGCEGDPLFAADVIEPAIRRIRSLAGAGTINMNTNASQPKTLERLFEAGLDSIRVSMNSVRKVCYDAYFRPKGYRFSDVVDSVDLAIARNKFVSINYLNCPGFTDTPEEVEALISFIRQHPIHLIQWRNLNFDPVRYWRAMSRASKPGRPMGMKKVLGLIHRSFPQLKFGYFNPPKEKFKSSKAPDRL